MIISLIGMSGSGKSHWSKQLEQKGFKRVCCDDLIEAKLSNELKKLGYSGIADVSKWMGQPYDKRYSLTSKKYLEIETQVMGEVLNSLINEENIIIDTTGSVIYVNPEILKKLSTECLNIYLKVPKEVEKEMFDLYIQDPKPVIWGKSFTKNADESNLDALKKCYPKLLEYRSKQYEKIANKTLDYFMLRSKDFEVNQFLNLIK